jgi:hypothetical protein
VKRLSENKTYCAPEPNPGADTFLSTKIHFIILFIYCVFINAVSSSYYLVSNDRMINK